MICASLLYPRLQFLNTDSVLCPDFSAIGEAPVLAEARLMNDNNLSVYVLRSERFPDWYYTGIARNVARRVEVHNSGGSQSTSRLRPWKLVVALQFDNEVSALAFEKYLKTGSGRAFSKRHFV